MIDAALFTWLWANSPIAIAWSIANAIPLETLAYAVAMLATVWLNHNEAKRWQERVHQLEQNEIRLASALNATNNAMALVQQNVDARLNMQDRMIEMLRESRVVLVGDDEPASESSSSGLDE